MQNEFTAKSLYNMTIEQANSTGLFKKYFGKQKKGK
jgi:hypothetical protein